MIGLRVMIEVAVGWGMDDCVLQWEVGGMMDGSRADR